MATVTAKPEPARPQGGVEPRRRLAWPRGSRLGRLIIILNVLALAIVVVGALVLNELRSGLVNARIDSLTTQGELIANVIDQSATVGEPEPALDPYTASAILQVLFIPRSQRARLFDAHGKVLADSFVVADHVDWKVLPPARKPGQKDQAQQSPREKARAERARQALADEIARAMKGHTVAGTRVSEDGDRVVSVSIPIQHVRAVLGVLTLEAGDVDQIISAERKALLPFIVVAMIAILVSSVLLHRLIAVPVLRLARAADHVRLQGARAISLPDLSERSDELGDLSRSLEEMTHSLSERMDAIERFAADVAHEIKNPLTSIRSAIETLDLVTEPAPRARLLAILRNDVNRLDRLVTDISNASRLDAELSREQPKALDLAKLLGEVAGLYDAQLRPGPAPGSVRVTFAAEDPRPMTVLARETPIGQVFRNLIDNARSFSPDDGEVRVVVNRARGKVTTTVEDDGPGIPPDNLETIFERFYTSRPKGRAFGGNSGLGLSIARQIVEAHGGTIRAENRMDPATGAIAGARFIVELPDARE
ncbi:MULTISPECIES: ATP-binding protein [Caulobacter]|uniref:histidine kinase n=1 Tax=Caulobacter vibrioides OR37 TaxID=1292034 RepID=R0CUQ1_CAUVI|nr:MULTISPECIES: ATP-binding protein [Caulobacter]ENZ80246.1 signal transduction histidine kinase [Caulobacter vibrioides OR37]MBQ1560584.1 sensor N-terminal transmembrane domain-containing protein [Caulobacter sp.]